MYSRRRTATGYRRPGGTRRKYGRSLSRRNANAYDRQKTMVVTNSRTSNSANRVGARGLTKISTGRFRDMPTLWPDRFMMKMKYTDSVNTVVTIATGTQSNSVTYRANSLYDPLLTTANEQPIPGFTEMASMYGNYRVHATKITTNCVPNGTDTAGTLFTCGFSRFPPGFTASSSYSYVLASIGNPYTTWALVGAQAADPVNLENYVSQKKLVGARTVVTDDDFAAGVAANPAGTTYAYVVVALPANATANTSYTIITELEFWAEFYGRDFELA